MRVDLEDFLKQNNFELDTYYETNKRYRKEITECQSLYVRIFSDVNKIVDVEYENIGLTKYETSGIISFETINTIKQLKNLLKAFSSTSVKKKISDNSLKKCIDLFDGLTISERLIVMDKYK